MSYYGEKTQNGKGILYNKNKLGKNEMRCVPENYNYMCHPYTKGSGSNFN